MRGLPKDSRAERFSWRVGVIETYFDSSSDTSRDGGSGAWRKYCGRRIDADGVENVEVDLEPAVFAACVRRKDIEKAGWQLLCYKDVPCIGSVRTFKRLKSYRQPFRGNMYY